MRTRALQTVLILLVAFNVFAGVRLYRAMAAAEDVKEDSGYSNLALLARAMQLIRQDYVDESKVSYESLAHAALRGMLSSLDPHSQFMEQRDFKGMQEDTTSRFGGLGIVVSVRDENLTIISPMEGSPGHRAGLLPGDQIVKIDGKSTEKMEIGDAMNLLRGEPGQKITLTILRPSTKEIKDYPLVRENIKVASVKEVKVLPAETTGNFKIGYARITQFNVPTSAELHEKLTEIEKNGLDALVLDLRYNPGGLLTSAVDVAGQFLPPRTVVASTEGRTPSQSRVYRTPNSVKQRPGYPVAILINNGSASGAEIVAGALKDLNRAILIGETTFGKGSVQSVVPLQDGTAVRLTTAKYYTPSKQVIHEHGVTPNITATFTPEQERMLLSLRRDELYTEAEKREFGAFRDTQLERAIDALKGVMIYAAKTEDGKAKR